MIRRNLASITLARFLGDLTTLEVRSSLAESSLSTLWSSIVAHEMRNSWVKRKS
jgi:hypothetical protein